jgi:hypothetical protein
MKNGVPEKPRRTPIAFKEKSSRINLLRALQAIYVTLIKFYFEFLKPNLVSLQII